MIRIALLLAVTGIVVLMLGQSELSAGVLQGGGTGTIEGIVFEDLNGNGVQDPGESGLHGRVVRLRQGPTQVAETSTGADGSFSFTQVAPGAYTVSVDLHGPGAGLCIDSFGGFDPLRIDDCYQG